MVVLGGEGLFLMSKVPLYSPAHMSVDCVRKSAPAWHQSGISRSMEMLSPSFSEDMSLFLGRNMSLPPKVWLGADGRWRACPLYSHLAPRLSIYTSSLDPPSLNPPSLDSPLRAEGGIN